MQTAVINLKVSKRSDPGLHRWNSSRWSTSTLPFQCWDIGMWCNNESTQRVILVIQPWHRWDFVIVRWTAQAVSMGLYLTDLTAKHRSISLTRVSLHSCFQASKIHNVRAHHFGWTILYQWLTQASACDWQSSIRALICTLISLICSITSQVSTVIINANSGCKCLLF